MTLLDSFQRRITYVRVSVTDRCDLRCSYCMPERMAFLPKAEVLNWEELDRLCALFVRLGVRKLRITGGEPLVRRDVLGFVGGLARHLESGALDELTLTTNGTRLAEFAPALAEIGVRRVNVSLDTLDRETFKAISRRDQLDAVLAGIEAARAAGLKVKLNIVALKRLNAHDLPQMIDWAHARDMDVTLIETMPLGEIDEHRTDQFISLAQIRADMESYWRLTDLPDRTGGPSRYVRVEDTGGRLGFITPLSHTFCADCNRVRLTCTGRLYLCLGQDAYVDFRGLLRNGADDAALEAALRAGLAAKPKSHDFRVEDLSAAPALARHMSTTGG